MPFWGQFCPKIWGFDGVQTFHRNNDLISLPQRNKQFWGFEVSVYSMKSLIWAILRPMKSLKNTLKST